jgi:hypothetical protein
MPSDVHSERLVSTSAKGAALSALRDIGVRVIAHKVAALSLAPAVAAAAATVWWAVHGLNKPVPRYVAAIAGFAGFALPLAVIAIRQRLVARHRVARLTIVESKVYVGLADADSLEVTCDWVITPDNREYVPARADLRLGEDSYRGGVSVIGGTHPTTNAVPVKQPGHVRCRFRISDDVARRAGRRLVGNVTLTDSTDHGTTRTVDFGEIPVRQKPKEFNWS